jgi:hypothetical protein
MSLQVWLVRTHKKSIVRRHNGEMCQYYLFFRCIIYKEINEMESKNDLPIGRLLLIFSANCFCPFNVLH